MSRTTVRDVPGNSKSSSKVPQAVVCLLELDAVLHADSKSQAVSWEAQGTDQLVMPPDTRTPTVQEPSKCRQFLVSE